MIEPLALNPPGTTRTHALLPNSPAVNHIPAGSCVETEDQRGVHRPQGAGCDVGAYELIVAAGAAPALGGVGLLLLVGLLLGAGVVVLRNKASQRLLGRTP
jgi:hypothetical protein